jgi:hypothetical protein
MKNILRKNHHSMRKLSGTNVGCVSACRDFSTGEIIVGKEQNASWGFRHRAGKSKLFHESWRNAVGHNVPQNFYGIKQPQFRGFDDGHNLRNTFLAELCPIPERNFPEKYPGANSALGKIIRGFYRRIFKEDEKLVFEFNQPLADIVGFVVRQRFMLVQFSEPFNDVFSAGAVFPFCQYGAGIFAIEKYTKFFKGAKITFVRPIIAVFSVLPGHCKKYQFKKLKYQKTKRRIRQLESRRMRVGGYFYR